MSGKKQFWGVMNNYNYNNTTVSRGGEKAYGMNQETWSWQGSIKTRVWCDKEGVNRFKVMLIPHPQTGVGVEQELVQGTLDGNEIKVWCLEEINLLKESV